MLNINKWSLSQPKTSVSVLSKCVESCTLYIIKYVTPPAPVCILGLLLKGNVKKRGLNLLAEFVCK